MNFRTHGIYRQYNFPPSNPILASLRALHAVDIGILQEFIVKIFTLSQQENTGF